MYVDELYIHAMVRLYVVQILGIHPNMKEKEKIGTTKRNVNYADLLLFYLSAELGFPSLG